MISFSTSNSGLLGLWDMSCSIHTFSVFSPVERQGVAFSQVRNNLTHHLYMTGKFLWFTFWSWDVLLGYHMEVPIMYMSLSSCMLIYVYTFIDFLCRMWSGSECCAPVCPLFSHIQVITCIHVAPSHICNNIFCFALLPDQLSDSTLFERLACQTQADSVNKHSSSDLSCSDSSSNHEHFPRLIG